MKQNVILLTLFLLVISLASPAMAFEPESGVASFDIFSEFRVLREQWLAGDESKIQKVLISQDGDNLEVLCLERETSDTIHQTSLFIQYLGADTAYETIRDWTSDACWNRFMYSWYDKMGVISPIIQERYGILPLDINKMTQLVLTGGGAMKVDEELYFSGEIDGHEWEIVPIHYLDANGEQYETFIYCHMYMPVSEMRIVTDWCIADPDTVETMVSEMKEAADQLGVFHMDLTN